MRPILRFLRALAEFSVRSIGGRELALIVGLALAGYGLDQIYAPAAFVVVGAVLTATAVFGIR